MLALSTIGARVSNWVRTNIAGNPGDIDNDFGKVEDGLGKVKEDLDKIDEDTKLRPPSLKNFKNHELILFGAGLGGAVGGGLGLADSLVGSAMARPEVVITETKVPVFKTELTGHRIEETPRYDRDGLLQGWDIRHVPTYNREQIGTVTERTHEVRGTDGTSPLVAGITGLAIGAGIGAGLGAAVAFGRLAINQGYEEHERRPVKGEAQILVKTGAVGAALGAGAGLLNAMVESNNAIRQSYSTEAAVTETRTGQIPENWFRSAIGMNNPPTGTQNVTYETTKTGFLGRPSVDSREVEVTTEGRFGLIGGVVGGALIGGIAGVGVGVALNVLRRTI